MGKAQFDCWLCRRQQSMWLITTSETVIALICVMWGIQLATTGHIALAQGEPLSKSLSQFTPWLAVEGHGYALFVNATMHLYCIVEHRSAGRRWCLLLQAGFFSFVWWSLVLQHIYAVGIWTLPIPTVACLVNCILLTGPKEQHGHETACRVADGTLVNADHSSIPIDKDAIIEAGVLSPAQDGDREDVCGPPKDRRGGQCAPKA